MKLIITLIMSLNIFAGGYGSTGTWPTGKRIINLDEVLKIRPNFKLKKFKHGIVDIDKESGLLLLKTKARVVAVKSVDDISSYRNKETDMKEMVDFEMFYEDTRENAVLKIKERINPQELLPFNFEDFL
ncbi:MAG: hypothetical protein BM556_09090 [Bacteriovorax sp. MedPE-SWde]|nr:MAG: hypothetical protein BM556_09090 [Bacteriovorax sp. MedPE-SWde]